MLLSKIVSLFWNFFFSIFYRAVKMFRHQESDDDGVRTAVETESSSESSSSNSSDIHGRFILMERVLQERVEQSTRAQGAAPVQETVIADPQSGRFWFLCCMNYYGCLYCHSKNCLRAGHAPHLKCSCQQQKQQNGEGNRKKSSQNCEVCGTSFEGEHFCEPGVGKEKPEEEDNGTNKVQELTKGTASVDDSFLMKESRSKLVKIKNEVEVQRNDPSSPLHSVKSFEELPLSEQLCHGVYDMGFNKPSKIQETAPPRLLADRPNKMIVQSQSGTGKTASTLLSMDKSNAATKHLPPVDKLKLSNTSTTKPTKEEQDNTEEDNGTNKMQELTKGTAPVDASFFMKVLRGKLVKIKNEVKVQRNDPSSPLHSVKSFEELPLSEQLRRGVYDMGFNKPSKIQETALPMLLADPPNNMIAQSQSGTGKTAAFVLSMLSRVDATKNFPQVICISPTYELALQTGQVAEKMAKFCPEVKIGYAVRGKKVLKGLEVLDHIIFATPGTLLYWIQRHRVLDPKKIKMFVLDEADVMIAQQGHQDPVIRIRRTLPKDCQMLLFSATYDDEVMKFAKTVVPDPIIIQLRREEESLDNIKQYYVVCRDKEDKYQALSNMYGVVSIGQCIVFCDTRQSASWLAEKMTADGHSVELLLREITVEQRLAALNRFRKGSETRLLITTTVNVRGIDVEQVTVVINYDMPVEPTGKPDYETYLHKIGRTGRFGKSGIAVNFIDGRWSMTIMKKIEKYFGQKISLLRTDDVDELEKLELFNK